MESAVWGLLGTIVGALASVTTAWLATRNSYELQQQKSRGERDERASDFQRQTLLDLQEAIHDALRLVNRAHIEDSKAHRATKDWGKNMLSEEVNEGVRLAQRRVAILVQRVSDDHLRTNVKSLMSSATNALLSRSEQESSFHLARTAEDAEQVLEGIGTVLRRHLD